MYRNSYLVVVLLLVLLMAVVNGAGAAADKTEIVGDWTGEIDLQVQKLGIDVHFINKDGVIEGKIDIPQQLAKNLPLIDIKTEGRKISFVLPVNPAGYFTGEFSEDKIEGNFDQGPYHGTFTLSRLEKAADEKSAGPVEVKAAGTDKEVVLETPTGNIYGTLTLPESSEKVPVVLIIAGSGETDRDGNNPLAGKINTYKKIARSLQESGIAALRYDKRAVAASKAAGGDGVLFDDFIDDASAWLEKLQSDQRFNRVIILGHSQGSLVGIAAADRVGAAGLISLAGTGRNISEVLLDQMSALPENLYHETEKIIASLREGERVPEVSSELNDYFAPTLQDFLISWFNYEPAEIIKGLDIPVLIIQGSTDLQAYPADFENLVRAYPEAESKMISGMNHVLREAPADPRQNLMTYSNPELPLFPGLMEEIIKFINKVQ